MSAILWQGEASRSLALARLPHLILHSLLFIPEYRYAADAALAHRAWPARWHLFTTDRKRTR